MTVWGERLIASAIGATVVGIVLALAGIGPERVLTGLVAIAAAALLGALLDDLVDQAPSRRPVTATPTVPPAEPVAVEPRSAVATPPRIGSQRTAGHVASPGPAIVATPAAQWEGPRRPQLDRPSGRWAASAGRDLVAVHRTNSGDPDVVCTLCGRTVPASRGDRPADCPAPLGTVPCTLAPHADVLWTDFRAVPRVSPGDAHDLV